MFVVNVGPATGAEGTFDYFRTVSALPLPTTPTATRGRRLRGSSGVRMGGRCTIGPMAIHESGFACGGRYVSSAATNDGEAAFSLTVPQAGNYYVWARVRGNDWTGNSFYVSFDGADPIHYEVPQFGGSGGSGGIGCTR